MYLFNLFFLKKSFHKRNQFLIKNNKRLILLIIKTDFMYFFLHKETYYTLITTFTIRASTCDPVVRFIFNNNNAGVFYFFF